MVNGLFQWEHLEIESRQATIVWTWSPSSWTVEYNSDTCIERHFTTDKFTIGKPSFLHQLGSKLFFLVVVSGGSSSLLYWQGQTVGRSYTLCLYTAEVFAFLPCIDSNFTLQFLENGHDNTRRWIWMWM
jgi:hypothetical protein